MGRLRFIDMNTAKLGGLQMRLPSEHNDGSGFQIAINFFVSDGTGRAGLLLESTADQELEILH